jgi:ABC-type transporter Mla subunit MlaD
MNDQPRTAGGEPAARSDVPPMQALNGGVVTLSENAAAEPGDDLVREFRTMIGAVVDDVHRKATGTVDKAAGTVQEARDDIQKVVGDLRSRLQDLERTARQARDAVNPVADLSKQVESLNETFTRKVADVSHRLDQLQGQTNAVVSQVEAARNDVQEMDRAWRQILTAAEKRQKWFVASIGLFLIATGTILWAAVGILFALKVLILRSEG